MIANLEETLGIDIDTIFQKEKQDGLTEDNFEILIQYYLSLTSSEEKDFFCKKIFNYKYHIGDEIVYRYSDLIIKGRGFLFIKIIIFLGKIKEILSEMEEEIMSGDNIVFIETNQFYGLLRGYEDILSEIDGNNLYAHKLSRIVNTLKYDSDKKGFFKFSKDECLRNIVLRKFNNIKVKINQIDIEIKSDQNEVVKLIQEFGFGSELNEYLTDLSSKNIMEEDHIAFAGTIGTYREFFSNMIIEISDKIVEILGEEKGEYSDGKGGIIITPTGIARRHIKEKLQLSDKDNNLINKYMDIVHDEGGHNMFSTQTYFRLTKNIGIEILYMLLSKLKELEKLRSS